MKSWIGSRLPASVALAIALLFGTVPLPAQDSSSDQHEGEEHAVVEAEHDAEVAHDADGDHDAEAEHDADGDHDAEAEHDAEVAHDADGDHDAEAEHDADVAHDAEVTQHEDSAAGDHGAHDHGKASFSVYGLVRDEPGYKEFNLKLDRFKYTPEVLRVNKGDRVKINLDSMDVEHGLYLDGYDIQILVPEKGFTTLEFVANKSGAFRFRCSSTCGPFHPFMIGKLVVSRNYLFWGSLASVIFIPASLLTIFTRKRKIKNEHS